MEDLKTIIKNTDAELSHICNGKVYFKIFTSQHAYQLEIDSMEKDWENVHIYPKYKSITLMRWIREALETNNERLVLLR